MYVFFTHAAFTTNDHIDLYAIEAGLIALGHSPTRLGNVVNVMMDDRSYMRTQACCDEWGTGGNVLAMKIG